MVTVPAPLTKIVLSSRARSAIVEARAGEQDAHLGQDLDPVDPETVLVGSSGSTIVFAACSETPVVPRTESRRLADRR